MQMKLTVKESGKLKALKLNAAQYRQLGNAMLAANKRRIARGINADGNPARPLSKAYEAIKRKVRRVARPIRDMRLTGVTMNSYQITRAHGGIIRAEPTTGTARTRAFMAQRLEPMIGFTPVEERAVIKEARAMFGKYVQVSWEKK